jgi:predicted metal-dependent hydrolase
MPEAVQTIGERAAVAHQEAEAAHDELVETLQRELELRNQEIARLHTVIERQALAIEQTAAALPQLHAGPSAESETADAARATPSPAHPAEGFWQRLRRLIRGEDRLS